jgi:hypothetical protein
MNVLLGRVKKSDGKLFVNGKSDDLHKYINAIGFVPQVIF